MSFTTARCQLKGWQHDGYALVDKTARGCCPQGAQPETIAIKPAVAPLKNAVSLSERMGPSLTARQKADLAVDNLRPFVLSKNSIFSVKDLLVLEREIKK
jgi:hypothetical protein